MTVGELFVMFGIKDDGSFRRFQGQLSGFATNVTRTLRGIGLGFGAFGLAKTLITAGDEYSMLHSRLALVAKDQNEVNDLFARAQEVAKNTRSDLGGTVRGFVSVAQSVAGMKLGLSNNEIFDRLELLQKQMKISGSSTQATKAAFTQLMQGLASNRLGGEEMRSVLEQLPTVADQLAKHLGVSRGKLRELSKDGKLTAKVVLDAFGPKYAEQINAQFAKVKATAADHWQQMRNHVVTTFGKLASDVNLVEAVRVALEAFAKVITVVADAVRLVASLFKEAFSGNEGAQAVLIGLAVAIMTFVVPALWAMAAPVIAVMLPFLAIAAVVALIAYGILKLIKYAPQIKAALGDAWEWVKRKALDFWDWLSGLPDRFVGVLEDFGNTVIDAFDRVWQAIVEGAEQAFNWVSDKARSIPVLGWIGEKIGHGLARVSGYEPPELDAIDQVMPAPYANASGSTSNVQVNAPMNLTINGVKDAHQATDVIGDVVDRKMRHAMHDVGGQP